MTTRTLDELDRRKTTYRFDAERDVPWARAHDDGVYFTDAMLADLGFALDELGQTPGARASLDALLALATAEIFQQLEDDVIRFVAQEHARRASVSATLLVDEERKHVALFARIAETLRARHPREAGALAEASIAPPSFDHLAARAGDYTSADELAFTFWLNTVFFEEYTVYFHHALEARSGDEVQPLWLTAHKVHRQEEAQHVLTDAAYLAELPLDAQARRRLSKAFVFFLDKNAALFFGTGAAARALATLYPAVAGLPGARPLRALPLFDAIAMHPAFRQTRAAAPYLDELTRTHAAARAAPDREERAHAAAPASHRDERAHAAAGPARDQAELAHGSPTDSIVRGAPRVRAADEPRTLWAALERAAARADIGVTFVRPDASPRGGGEDVVPYAELRAASAPRLAALRAHGARAGDHVMLLTALPADTVPWLWACVRGGLVAAPLALPTTADDAAELERLIKIHAQLESPIVVCDDATAPLVMAALTRDGAPPPRVLASSAFRSTSGPSPHDGPAPSRASAHDAVHDAHEDDVAILQFSSGSMGDPRGVRLTHANLLADIHGMLQQRGESAEEVFVSWMPLFHDMGLIGYHLTPVVAGARQILMSPLSFMREPMSWLHALSRHRATITGAPNFALARLAPRLARENVSDLDLSRLHTFLVGAEPIAARALDAFAAALARAGLRAEAICPAYGLAEATLAVTMVPRGEAPRALCVSRDALARERALRPCAPDDPHAQLLVDLGVPLPGLALRIVDDDGDVVTEGRVGSIELAGPSVSHGYHARPARLSPVSAERGDSAGDAGGERWLDTGDLGAIRDGRLFVTGRKKDVFFVGGRNYYANDVEAVARELDFLHPGAVALVIDWNETWGVDELSLFVALRPDVVDRRAALADVHTHVARRVGVQLGRVIEIDKRRLPRTTSGKLKRRALLAGLRDGAFADALTFVSRRAHAQPEAGGSASTSAPSVERVPHDEANVDAVRRIWARALEVDVARVGPDSEFRALGGDSFQAVQIHDAVERTFASTFTPELLVLGTTPRKMAMFVELARASTPVIAAAAPAMRTSLPVEPSRARDDEIAIVSLAVRVPRASTPDEMWRLLVDGVCSIGVLPAARADEAQRLGALVGERALTRGSWFADVDRFDPAPFGMSDAEARALGPAQRFFLEVAFEALAGAQLSSRRVGIFVGAGADGYAQRYADDPALVTHHSLLGALPNMVAARVARVFGLTGPALTVDTACSSSLAAVHMACDSLRRGECDAAIAGGVQVGLSVELLLAFQRAGLLSPTGEARPFDDAANGLVPGEAAGAVLLKRRADAERDGDRVWALVRGSAMNNDGGALSGTAPSPQGQRDVVTAAWRAAGVSPKRATFIEAHAAGTAVGDAVEAQALGDVIAAAALDTSEALGARDTLGQRTGARESACAVGSVKGNLGHTLAAAGIMSLLKAVLALTQRAWPRTAGLASPAARIDLPRTGLALDTAEIGAFAGVSSFGLGGTNVHVVLAAPTSEARARAREPRLVAVGAPTVAELTAREQHVRDRLAHSDGAGHEADHDDVIAASAGFADLLPARRAFIVRTASLAARASDAPQATARGALAFVFPGPGSQVPGMGRALYESEPAFRVALDACARAAAASGIDLLALLFTRERDGTRTDADANPSRLGARPHHAHDAHDIYRLANAQPAVFAYGVALAHWLLSTGARPVLVMGHSAGEYAAAHVAGALSLDDAMALVIARGRAMAAAAPGRMAAVLAARIEVERALSSPDAAAACAGVGVAAVNAPRQVAISGPTAAMDAACATLERAGLTVRALAIDCAAHSSALRAAAAPFDAALARARLAPLSISLVSSLTGGVLPRGATLDAEHFRRHLVAPVDFVGAVRAARAAGVDAFAELGASAGLATCVQQIVDADAGDALVVSCGLRGEDERETALSACAALIDAGLPVRASAFLSSSGPRSSRAPADALGYPYARRRLWIDARARTLLPTTTASTRPMIVVSRAAEPAIRDHVAGGQATAPASLLVDVLMDALRGPSGATDLAQVVVERPLAVAPDEERAIEIERVGDRVTLVSSSLSPLAAGGVPTRHITARVEPARGRVAARLDVGEIRARLTRDVAGAAIYARLGGTGFVMGDAMRSVESVRVGARELLARLASPAGTSRGRRVDPALLDGASHAVAGFFVPSVGGAVAGAGARADADAPHALYLGFAMEAVRFHRSVHEACLAYVRLRAPLGADPQVVRYDIALLSNDGEILVEVDDFSARRVASPRVNDDARTGDAGSHEPDPRALGDVARDSTRDSTRGNVRDTVRRLVAARLRRPAAQIGDHVSLARLGVDSLMAVALVRELEAELNVKLYATLLFDAHTIAAVADRVSAALGGDS